MSAFTPSTRSTNARLASAAVRAHANLAAAYERGFLADLITPYLGVERDGRRGGALRIGHGELRQVAGALRQQDVVIANAPSVMLPVPLVPPKIVKAK